MKLRALLFITLLASLSFGNAQQADKEDDEDVPTTVPSDSPSSSPTDPAPSLDPLSFAPSSSPIDRALPETSSPTGFSSDPLSLAPSETPIISESIGPSSFPFLSFVPSPTPVDVENCYGQVCDPFDNDACSCRPRLKCRLRPVAFEQRMYICSQLPKKRRNRLSDELENVGGAAGRQNRGRGKNRANTGE